MPEVVISLLQGVNVGKTRRVKMEDLRAMYVQLGFESPQTYVQSGNVVCRSTSSDLPTISARLEKAFQQTFGFFSDFILRTVPEMKQVISDNPFAGRSDMDPSKFLVTFLKSDPGPAVRAEIEAFPADPEEIRMVGRELYIYFPNGMGRSKLNFGKLDKAAQIPGTGRNWNSVNRILALAEQMI